MNCQETNQLLDAFTDEAPTPMQREAVDRHLATCPACRADWASWHEMAALPIPPAPVALRGRIAAVVLSRLATPARRSFRPFLIGTLFFMGVAAATALVLQYARRDATPATQVAELKQPAPVVPVAQLSSPPPAGLTDMPLAAIPAATDAAEPSLDPHGIVVLKRPDRAADPRAIAMNTLCHDAIVRQLRNVKGLTVIADAAVVPYEGNGQAAYMSADHAAYFELALSDSQIARKLGAGFVLMITTDGGCRTPWFNTRTGIGNGGMSSGIVPPVSGWDAFAAVVVQDFSDKALKDAATLAADSRSTLLNAALTDKERVSALYKIQDSSCSRSIKATRCELDKDVIAAAAYIGTKSKDADARGSVWASLRRVFDPSLREPLLEALASDPDESVRYQAALTLNTYLDVPGVREALLRAAAQDPSREPEVVCCILTVREAAQRAAVSDADYRGWVRSTLLDETLPVRSRLLPVANFSPDGRFMTMSIDDFGTDAARVVFDIGRYEQDPQVRAMAWGTLQRAAPNEAFLPVLLADMATHPNEGVRSAAALALENQSGKPEVRQAFERVLQDPSEHVRRIAIRVTGSGK